jgi:acyl-phosphate glycerol 3-phosphate acyltransferase
MKRALQLWLCAYLYGSLPFLWALAWRRGADLRRTGSGNIGGSNFYLAGGRGLAALGWVADASKGLLPVLALKRIGLPQDLSELSGAAGTAGQCWPVFLGFNGGRGISAFVGAGFAIDRIAWLCSILPMIGGGVWRILPALAGRSEVRAEITGGRSKSVPLGSLIGLVLFPLVVGMRRRRLPLSAAALSAVVLARRLSGPLPDDATAGPLKRRSAIWYRLLYDRNTPD